MKKPTARARAGSGVTAAPRVGGRSSLLSPPSCAAVIRAVSPVVASRPNSPHPAQSMSADAESGGLGREYLENAGEGLVEGGNSLGLELVSDCVHVDADAGQVA